MLGTGHAADTRRTSGCEFPPMTRPSGNADLSGPRLWVTDVHQRRSHGCETTPLLRLQARGRAAWRSGTPASRAHRRRPDALRRLCAIGQPPAHTLLTVARSVGRAVHSVGPRQLARCRLQPSLTHPQVRSLCVSWPPRRFLSIESEVALQGCSAGKLAKFGAFAKPHSRPE
jgi:hypothetical protein